MIYGGEPKMRFLMLAIIFVPTELIGESALADETIVFIRHAEKPGAAGHCDKSMDPRKLEDSTSGLGQLSCRGLNRALRLPRVIEAKVGRPGAIFAPNPADQKPDQNDDGNSVRAGLYDYVRPLATIEPTAISYQLPVNARIGFSNVGALSATLMEGSYHDVVVIVAWEHTIINEVECELLTSKRCKWENERSGEVAKWESCDFDRMDVIKIDWSKAKPEMTFRQDTEGLNGQPDACPN
jgi:hypothetical protein